MPSDLLAAVLAPASTTESLTIAIVLGGTLLGTLLRCGLRACGGALAAVAGLAREILGSRPFDAEKARAEMAVQIQDITRDGLLRANPHHFGDAELDEATDALFGQRSLAALIATHERWRSARMGQAQGAVQVLLQAAELAPVAGLAGTLISLSRLPADGVERSAYMVAIGMAVHATLYGLVAAHLLLVPLARAVERAAQREEGERQALVDWLASLLGGVGSHPAPLDAAADEARPRRAGRRVA